MVGKPSKIRSVNFAVMEDQEYKYYPPKPESGLQQQNWMKALMSMAFFVLIFLLFFGNDLNLVVNILLILFVHEVGHLTAMKLLKQEEKTIFFLPMVTNFEEAELEKKSQWKRIVTLFAGPLPGIVIGMLLVNYGASIQHQLVEFTGYAFMIINLFNLLPIDPLDGGKILETLFGKESEIVKLVFLFMALVIFLMATYFSFMLGLFSVFIGIRILAIFRMQKLRKKIVAEHKYNLEKHYSELSDEEYWEIRRSYLKELPNNPINPDRFEPFANEELLIAQIKGVLQSPFKEDIGVLGTVVTLLVWLATFFFSIWFVVKYASELV